MTFGEALEFITNRFEHSEERIENSKRSHIAPTTEARCSCSSAYCPSGRATSSFDDLPRPFLAGRAKSPRSVTPSVQPRSAAAAVQLEGPAGCGDHLRPHDNDQLVLQLPPFRCTRSSTAPERTGPTSSSSSLLRASDSASGHVASLARHHRCVTGATPAVTVGAGWLAALCLP